MDLTHAVTLAKVSRHDDPALAETDRARIGDWAQKLGFAPLNRLWQLLLKGHDEVLRANNPLEHLEMLLRRVIYAASLTDPGELAKRIEAGGIRSGERRVGTECVRTCRSWEVTFHKIKKNM